MRSGSLPLPCGFVSSCQEPCLRPRAQLWCGSGDVEVAGAGEIKVGVGSDAQDVFLNIGIFI